MTSLLEILRSEMVLRLGWALLHSLWEIALLAAVLAAVLAMLRRRSANLRYVTACVGLAAMFVLPVVTCWIVTQPPGAEVAAVSALPDNAAEISPTAPLLEAPLPAPEAADPPFPAPDAAEAALPALTPASVAPGAPTAQEASSPGPPGPEGRNATTPLPGRISRAISPWIPWLVTAWLIGVFSLSVWHLGGWIATQRLKHWGTTSGAEQLTRQLAGLIERMKVSRPVQMLQSAMVDAPVLIGWLRPVILVPAAMLSGMPPRQLEAILAHELAHVRRYDYLVNLFQTLVETLLFYHPAVWWLSRRIRIEREHCCDDAAVAVCGSRVDYAAALMAMEQGRMRPRLAVAAGGSGRGGTALSRVRRVLNVSGRDPIRPQISLVGVFLVVALVGLLAGYIAAAGEHPQKPEQDAAGETAEEGAAEEEEREEENRQPADLKLEARVVGIDGKPLERSSITFWEVVDPEALKKSDKDEGDPGFDDVPHVWHDRATGKTWRPIHNFGAGDRATKEALGPGDYRVTAYAGQGGPTMLAVSDPVHLDGSRKHTVVTLRIQDGPSLRIELVDAQTGKPLEYAGIRLVRPDGLPVVRWSSAWSVHPRGNEHTFEHLAPGEYTLEVFKRAYRYGDRQYAAEQGPMKIRLAANQDRQMTVKLKAVGPSEEEARRRWPWAVTGTVTDGQGRPLEGVQLRANCGMGTLFPTGETVTDKEGKYTLRFGPGMRVRDDATGTWGAGIQAATIFAFKSGYTEKNLCRQGGLLMGDKLPDKGEYMYTERERVVLPNKPRRLDFVMVAAANLEGELVDERGEPIADKGISVQGKQMLPSTSVLAQGKTDGQGRFRFEGVPANYGWWFTIGDQGRTQPITFPSPGTYHVKLQLAHYAQYNLDVFRITGVTDPEGNEVGEKLVGDDPSARPPVAEELQEQGRSYLRKMAAACRDWLGPPPAEVRNYEYRFRLGEDEPTTHRVDDASRAAGPIRQGITYFGTPHALASRPEKVVFRQVEVGQETILLRFLVQDSVKIAAGNGISGTWRGYFSTPLREGLLVLDKATCRPARTEVGGIRETFSRYMGLVNGRFVPLAIRIEKGSMDCDWKFRVYRPGLWLLSESRTHDEEGRGEVLVTVDQVKVNGQPAVPMVQDGAPAPPKPPVEGEGPAWGPAVEGVQARLRADKRVWKLGQQPTFKVDIRNGAGSTLYDTRGRREIYNLELDGHWYVDPSRVRKRPLEISAGGRLEGLSLLPLSPKHWRRTDPPRAPELTAGKHTVRVAFVGTLGAAPEAAGGKAIRALSNAVEIEIVQQEPGEARPPAEDQSNVGSGGADVDDQNAVAALRQLGPAGAELTLDKEDRVTKVSLSPTRATAEELALLRGLPRLEWLSIGRLVKANPPEEIKMTEHALVHLRGLKGLKRLWLGGVPVTDASLAHLKGLTELEYLSISHTQITDKGLVHLQGLAKLTDLRLANTHVTDEGLAYLEGLGNLQFLDVTGTGVTDGGLAHLMRLAKLRWLDLTRTKVNGFWLIQLNGLTDLRHLGLDSTQVTDANLARLTGVRSLESLSLNGTKITDAGLEHLKKLPGLQRLYLSSTGVTDGGVVHLAAMSKLTDLDLRGTKVTGQAVEKLKQALPNTRIRLDAAPSAEVYRKHVANLVLPQRDDPYLPSQKWLKDHLAGAVPYLLEARIKYKDQFNRVPVVADLLFDAWKQGLLTEQQKRSLLEHTLLVHWELREAYPPGYAREGMVSFRGVIVQTDVLSDPFGPEGLLKATYRVVLEDKEQVGEHAKGAVIQQGETRGSDSKYLWFPAHLQPGDYPLKVRLEVTERAGQWRHSWWRPGQLRIDPELKPESIVAPGSESLPPEKAVRFVEGPAKQHAWDSGEEKFLVTASAVKIEPRAGFDMDIVARLPIEVEIDGKVFGKPHYYGGFSYIDGHAPPGRQYTFQPSPDVPLRTGKFRWRIALVPDLHWAWTVPAVDRLCNRKLTSPWYTAEITIADLDAFRQQQTLGERATDFDTKLRHFRNALTWKSNHPEKVALEYRVAVMLKEFHDSSTHTLPPSEWPRRKEALAMFRGILDRYNHMAYYTNMGAGSWWEAQLVLPHAAMAAANLLEEQGGDKKDAARYRARALEMMNQTCRRRIREWSTARRPQAHPFDGRKGEAKLKGQVAEWERRKKAAVDGEVLTVSELRVVDGIVPSIDRSRGGRATPEVLARLRQIAESYRGTAIARIARQRLEAAKGDPDVLLRQLNASELSDEKIRQITDKVLAIQGDPEQPWDGAWGDWLETARAKGKVSDGDFTRYARQSNPTWKLLALQITREDGKLGLSFGITHFGGRVASVTTDHNLIIKPRLVRLRLGNVPLDVGNTGGEWSFVATTQHGFGLFREKSEIGGLEKLEPGKYEAVAELEATIHEAGKPDTTLHRLRTQVKDELKLTPLLLGPAARPGASEPTAEDANDEAWGKPVAGVQCRLEADKPAWKSGEAATLKAYVRHQTETRLFLSNHPSFGAQLEVDGHWHRWNGPLEWAGPSHSSSKSRTKDGQPLKITLDDNWKQVDNKQPLRLDPGKHVIRFAWEGHPERAPREGPDEQRNLVLTSNPVEITILPERPEPKPAETAFGPVIERIVSFSFMEDAAHLDLDTGKQDRSEPRKDLITAAEESDARVRSGLDMVAIPVDASRWNASPDEILAEVAKAEPQRHVRLGGPESRRTFFFKTREGGVGVLRIVPINEGQANVKVLYKLLLGTGKQTTWGPAVDGVQCRLEADKPTWKAVETPRFKAYVRHQTETRLFLSNRPDFGAQLEVDGHWHRYVSSAQWQGQTHGSSKSRTKDGQPLAITLDDNWKQVDNKQPLRLDPGRHVIRFAWEGHPERAPREGPDEQRNLVLTSNPVEITILPERPEPKSADIHPADKDAAAALKQLGAILEADDQGRIRSVRLSRTAVTDAGLEHLKGLSGLKALHLDDTRITDAGLQQLLGLTGLETLSVNYTRVGDAGLEHLNALKGLRSLALLETEVTAAGVRRLKKTLPELQTRVDPMKLAGLGELRGWRNSAELSDDYQLLSIDLLGPEVKDAWLERLKDRQSLQDVCLFRAAITDAGLAHLQGLTELHTLYLASTQITDAGLEYLKDMKKLKTLFLADTRISDAGLARLGGLTNLEFLWLGGTQVTDAGLVHLKPLTNLNHLKLNDCQISGAGLSHLRGLTKLATLELNETPIADAGLVHLKPLVNLELLYLSHTLVTDAGLEHLTGLTKLRMLEIEQTPVTEDGIKWLKQRLPKASFYYSKLP